MPRENCLYQYMNFLVLSNSFNDEDMQEDEKTSSRAFHLLLFCLARELLSVPYKLQHAPQPPPWMKQVLPQTRMLGMVHNKSRAGLFSHVREQVKVLFGWKPPLQKESLMIRWAQKHRDLVDQVSKYTHGNATVFQCICSMSVITSIIVAYFQYIRLYSEEHLMGVMIIWHSG